MKAFVMMLCLCAAVVSCGSRGGRPSGEVRTRPFPMVSVPAMLSDPAQRADYLVTHYWDGFFKGTGPSDTGYVLGVRRDEVRDNMMAYLSILHGFEVPRAADAVSSLFDQIEGCQARDSASLVYELMTSLVETCLYDPNSPLRSEDLYLPFVRKMIESPFTSRDKLPAYRFEAEKCSMNPYGSKAPDFEFKDASGRVHTLYGIEAGWTLLFFSNPGCHACQGIVSEIEAAGFPEEMIASGDLAVVNIYIDDEIDRWRAAAGEYPSGWYNGYDFRRVMNDGSLYYVRAIPSLYLLDADKRVIMKDAPTERVLAFLENAINS